MHRYFSENIIAVPKREQVSEGEAGGKLSATKVRASAVAPIK